MYTENETIINSSITQIMQSAYIDYSMSVIISRALPDVRDGLKPVQRRVLYAMLREGLLHNRAFDKCAGVVGEVLKNYHPHGDSSVYDTLTRLAQDWVMRYPLVMPQGNFGSIEGDSPAAYRYTECKLAEIAEDLLMDIDSDTVDFMPNYKETATEPVVLPSALPTLLMNGSTGIAVGMTTNIPPHNLGELIDGICMLIDNPSTPFEELQKAIKGPDFPTGGVIVGRGGIDSYMKTGRGIVKTRGVASVEELKNGKEQIVITEIPYNVNRNSLVENIAQLVADKVLTEVSDIRNESDENTRVVVELKRGESPRVVLNKLFKHTQLESSSSASAASANALPASCKALARQSPSPAARPKTAPTFSKAIKSRSTTSTTSSKSSGRRKTATRREPPSWRNTPSPSGRRTLFSTCVCTS